MLVLRLTCRLQGHEALAIHHRLGGLDRSCECVDIPQPPSMHLAKVFDGERVLGLEVIVKRLLRLSRELSFDQAYPSGVGDPELVLEDFTVRA